MQLNDLSKYSAFKKKYLTLERKPFFELAADHITPDHKMILDIGCGEGEFFVYLRERGIDTEHVYLLDANQATVEKNRGLTSKSIVYLVPDRLPFEDRTVDVIHLSHLLDNLQTHDLYNFLLEINRVLRPGGILAISTPVLWANFYDDLSHTRPYNPYVFYKYFVRQGPHSRFDKIQGQYSIQDLVYRYYELPLDEGWSSTAPVVDRLFVTARRIFRKLRIKRVQKNGYTLVLKKENEGAV